MANYVELYIDQGSDWNSVINLTDDIDNSSVNIFGYSVRSQIRKSYYSTNPSANITCTVTNFTTGEITLSLTNQETANIKAGRYLFDVETINNSNTVTRILEGIITILPNVTK